MQANWHGRSARHTRNLLALIAFGAMFVAAFWAAPGAHASPFYGHSGDHDQYAMWEDVISFAPDVTAADAGGFAQRVCGMLNAGNTEGYLISSASTQFSVTPTVVRYIIHAAEFHYCPTYYGTALT
jgi:hypothetical protein